MYSIMSGFTPTNLDVLNSPEFSDLFEELHGIDGNNNITEEEALANFDLEFYTECATPDATAFAPAVDPNVSPDDSQKSAAGSYPEFKYEWSQWLFTHLVRHRQKTKKVDGVFATDKSVLELDCSWCKVDHSRLDIPLTKFGHDSRLETEAFNIVIRGCVNKLLRVLFEEIYQYADGSNSAALFKGRMTKEQAKFILDNCPVENNIGTEKEYHQSCDNKFKNLLERNDIPYIRLLRTAGTPVSLVQSLLNLPTKVGQYAQLVEAGQDFAVLCYRLHRVLSCDSNELTTLDIAFILLCIHREGLVALTPSFYLNGYSSTVTSDAICSLLRTESKSAEYTNPFSLNIKGLECILDGNV